MSRFMGDFFKYVPSYIVPAVVGFLTIPIVTNLFSPEEYGYYSLVLVTISVLSILSNWLSMFIIRFYSEYEKKSQLPFFYGATIILLSATIILLTPFYMFALYVSKYYGSDLFFKLMLIAFFAVILNSILNVLLSFLRVTYKAMYFSTLSCYKAIASLVFGLIFILVFDMGIEGLLLGLVLSLALSLPFVWKVSIPKVSFHKNDFKPFASKMVKYSFPLIIVNLASWILSASDRYVLMAYRTAEEVGVYSVSYSLSEYSITLIASLFMMAGTPITLSIWENEGIEKTQSFLSRLCKYYLIIGVPSVVGISILSKSILCKIASSDYLLGYQIVPFVVMGVFLLGLEQRFHISLLIYEKTSQIMYCVLLAGFVNLLLNLIFIPQYGYLAAALTTLFSYFFLLLIVIHLSRLHLSWSFPFSTLKKTIFASAIMGISIFKLQASLNPVSTLDLFIIITVGFVVYFICLLYTGEIKRDEIILFKDTFRKVNLK